ncbi:MAG: hypothetical protein JO025_15395 [Verrucomicrobia bacterium]|nr:hypothetical protein [Verrucomicrobiota bacterium]
MLARIKQKISEIAQRALGIDGLRFQLDTVMNRLDESDKRLDKVFWQLRESSESFARLKSFLMWSSSRVEPWLPAENFAQTEPDYDLAGFLYNFLPNRTAVDAGVRNPEYAKALAEIGYQVFCLLFTAEDRKRSDTIEHARIKTLDLSSTSPGESAGREDVGPSLPARIDLMNVGAGYSEIGMLNRIAPLRPAVIQSEFANTEPAPSEAKEPVSETIKAMRDSEYYWNIIIYRTQSEDFVRMATNLATTPKQSWGKIFFFQDYQLFLKANHWCKAALPRFRAKALPERPVET